MFNKQIHENIQFFLILPPDLPPIGNYRLKIVIKIHMVLLLRVNISFILIFSVDFTCRSISKEKKKNIKNIFFVIPPTD